MPKISTGQFDYGPIYGYVDDEDNDVYVVDIQAHLNTSSSDFLLPYAMTKQILGIM